MMHNGADFSFCESNTIIVWVQAGPAEFILEHKPAAVVLESSFSAAGGNGAIVDCNDSSSHDGGALITSACGTAARLQSSSPDVFNHVWQVWCLPSNLASAVISFSRTDGE